jgi:hypothetical protein
MATRILHGINFFEHFLKMTTKGTFILSLNEKGSLDYEAMLFKVKVNGRPDAGRTDAGRIVNIKAHFFLLFQGSLK